MSSFLTKLPITHYPLPITHYPLPIIKFLNQLRKFSVQIPATPPSSNPFLQSAILRLQILF